MKTTSVHILSTAITASVLIALAAPSAAQTQEAVLMPADMPDNANFRDESTEPGRCVRADEGALGSPILWDQATRVQGHASILSRPALMAHGSARHNSAG
jgi:hypothetical protein